MAETLDFFATTAKAMEPMLADELRSLGAREVKETRAGVSFHGTLETAYRACLWSRVANRILLPLKSFPAPTPEKLYGGVKSIRWSDHLRPDGTLAVDFSSSRSAITHTHFGALKSKDAIVDQFKSVHGERPSIDTARPHLRVNIYVLDDVATVSIDLSGESLHLRSYREESTAAPLKENLASAILMLAGWPKLLEEAGDRRSDLAFIDPMCGSGTLPIEAALMAAGAAPGLLRTYWGFERWLGHVPALWKRIAEEARAKQIIDRKRLPTVLGFDEDPRAIRAAIAHVERAGLRGWVHVEKRALPATQRPAEKGLFVVNPPYGERLGEVEELKPLYGQIGDTMKRELKGWQAAVFTGSPELAKCIGLRANRRHVLFNGPIECRLLTYELYEGAQSKDRL